MNLKITPSTPHGTVFVPPSKSMAHRLLLCGGLAGAGEIKNLAPSQDVLATLDCLSALGATFEKTEDTVTFSSSLSGGELSVLPCRESGSTLRFFLPLTLLFGGGKLTGSARLFQRPLTVYEEVLAPKGISFVKDSSSVTVKGYLTPGKYALRGDVSSQFFTGLLFALPLLEGDSALTATTPLESASYLDLTLSALKTFGIRVEKPEENTFYIPGNQHYLPQTVTVEGDESNAAFFGLWENVTLSGRNPDTLQGDRVWSTLFARLKAGDCEISVKDCPDLAPVLMTAASLYHGCTLTDTRRLAAKESDRGVVMARELAKFGAKITVEENTIRVEKSPLHPPAEPLNGHNDHRVVMSLAVLSTFYSGIIQGTEACEKSYPDFFDVLKNLHVRWEEI